jgi:hypothetical protein
VSQSLKLPKRIVCGGLLFKESFILDEELAEASKYISDVNRAKGINERSTDLSGNLWGLQIIASKHKEAQRTVSQGWNT